MMSRAQARRAANALTFAFCLVGIGCTPSEPRSSQAEAAEADGSAPSEPAEAGANADETGPVEEPAVEEAGEGGEETGELAEAEPEGPQTPPDYGVFKFPAEPPSEDQLALHGAAGYEVVAIYGGPNKSSERLGFLRIGARMRVGEKIADDDCPRGWHALEGGGYACASRGLMVDSRPPFMSYEPKPPRVDEPFPYDWAYVRQWNTPQWWQVPNAEQLAATRELRAIREAERTGEPPPGSEPAPKPASTGGDAAPPPSPSGEGGGVEELPAPEGEDTGGAPPPPPSPPEPEAEDTGGGDGGVEPEPEPEEEEEPVNIPFSPSSAWLEKGYFLSLGEAIRENDRGYWRTARGGVVEKANAHSYEPKDYQGSALSEDMSFPVGFVMVKNGTKLLTLKNDDKLHATGKNLEKRTFLDLGEEVEIAGRAYFTVIPHPEGEDGGKGASEDGSEEAPALFVKAEVMRTADLQPLPKGLDPWDRWIDVDITKQMLVAYEGSRPAYVTLVSTGKKGTNEEPFETPTGRFRIRSKQITSNMDGATATDGNYAIQDVPWVMYFQGSYALHGAFWHRSFGYVRSHGCVNLGPSDARWLFGWTTPFVPEGWHGVSASDDNPGTTIVIRRS